MTSSPERESYFYEVDKEEPPKSPTKREVDLTNLTPGENAINECLLRAGPEGLSTSELLDQIGNDIEVNDIANSNGKGIWRSPDSIRMVHYSFLEE